MNQAILTVYTDEILDKLSELNQDGKEIWAVAPHYQRVPGMPNNLPTFAMVGYIVVVRWEEAGK